jgi:hypothetical protein
MKEGASKEEIAPMNERALECVERRCGHNRTYAIGRKGAYV